MAAGKPTLTHSTSLTRTNPETSALLAAVLKVAAHDMMSSVTGSRNDKVTVVPAGAGTCPKNTMWFGPAVGAGGGD
jgi:hypothetical protein